MDRQENLSKLSKQLAELILSKRDTMEAMEVALITIIKGIELLHMCTEEDEATRTITEEAVELSIKSVNSWGVKDE